MTNSHDKHFQRLREMAEKMVKERDPQQLDDGSRDIQELIGELQIYQAELEIQNEELRSAQVRLAESRDRLSILFEMAPVGYVVLDEAGIISDANRAITRLLKQERVDLIGKPFSRFLEEDDRALFYARYKAFFRHPEGKAIEVRLDRKDADALFVKLEGRFLSLEIRSGEQPADEPEYLLLTITDIDERRRIEAALRESEKKYRDIVNSAPVGIFKSTPGGKCLEANPALAAILGYADTNDLVDTVNRTSIADTLYADAGERSDLVKKIMTQTEWFTHENQYRKKDGALITCRVHFRTSHPPGGEPVIEGFVEDISEQKRLMETVAASENRYRSLFNNAPVGIFQSTPSGQFRLVNINFARMLGYETRKELMDSLDNIAELYVDPSQRERIKQLLARFGELKGNEIHMRRKDGSDMWMSIFVKTVWHENGDILYYDGFTIDVTEKKHYEASLKSSEEKFKVLIEQAADALFLFDENGRFLMVNQNACKTLGYSRDELLGLQVDRVDAEFTPERVREVLANLGVDGKITLEGVHMRKDGTRFPVEIRVGCLDVEQRNVYLALARDVSERKRIEEDREHLIRELRKNLDEIKTLKGLLPICSNCKKIRDDKGYWNQIESYIMAHSEVEFSHSICRDCARKLYPDLDIFDD